MSRFTRLPRSGDARASVRAAEREARRARPLMARRTDARTARTTGSGGVRDESPVPGPGRPLAPAERAPFEAALGYDFSRVRVHTDTASADAADRLGATAFTHGSHLVFGAGQFDPASEAGRGRMAHELAHAAQQEGLGEAVTQREPKGREEDPRGLGKVPPTEPVTIAKGVGHEDDFVLFDQDSAALSTADVKTLTRFAGNAKVPVVVEVNGYASEEGDADYNSNLSAHRAVAVKTFLEPLLPPGSEVRLFGRGETKAFGPLTSNRRAGVHVVPGAAPQLAPEKLEPREGPGKWTLTTPTLGAPNPPYTLGVPPLRLGTPGSSGLVPRFGLTPPTFVPVTPLVPPLGVTPTLPSTTSPIDWLAIRRPFMLRAVPLTDRDATAIEQNWAYSYSFFRSLGLSPEWAAWGANQGTAYAYDDVLSRENPTRVDLFNTEFDKLKKQQYPNEFRTPIVPIITPSTLHWMTKKVFHRDITFEF